MEVFVTPPIPTRRGLVVTVPNTNVLVQEQTGPIRYKTVKMGRADDKGEFYFPVKVDTDYRVVGHAAEMMVSSHHRRIFNSDFGTQAWSEPGLPDDSVWQTRGTTYNKGKSDYAKADPQCASIVDGKLVLRVMEGEKEGTFITGHVGTGDVNQPARFAFTHGWASAKVKFHPLRGALSGFWAQFLSGVYHELDIVEYAGTKNADGKGGIAHHTVWFSPGAGHELIKAYRDTAASEVGKDFDTDRCVFSVNWQPDFFDFWINTRRVARITEGLSNDPKFLVASILVRNYQLDDMLANLGKISTFADEYDWIRVWQ
jgi:hypothetical protein